jgi:hypothetical protein
MELIDILTKLGYKTTIHLANIIAKEKDLLDLQHNANNLQLLDPVTDIQRYIENWESQIGGSPEKALLSKIGNLENTWHGGPMLTDVTEHARAIIENILKEEGISLNGEGNSVGKVNAITKITEVFKEAAKGYILCPVVKALKAMQPIINRNPVHFKYSSITLSQLHRKVCWMEAIEGAGFTPVMCLKDMELCRNLTKSMIKAFELLETPDRYKTLEFKIEELKERTKKNHLRMISDKNTQYQIGFEVAIQGNNPILWDLVNGIGYKPGYFEEGTDSINIDFFGSFIETILEGYASSYFLAYLETECRKKDQVLASKTSVVNQSLVAPAAVKLKWGGQNNQLYVVIRHLKSEGFLLNSNEELAEILKAMVDVFNDTKTSTIQKELGRDQDLPKNRRIDLKKMTTGNSTS